MRSQLLSFAGLVAGLCSLSAWAQAPLRWLDVRELGVEGRGWTNTESYFDRLPATAQGKVPEAVWNLGHHSAGEAVRFTTDATTLEVRWELTSASLAMPHMPATGVSGVDLYVRHGHGWRWLATGQPRAQTNSATLATVCRPGSGSS